MNPGGECQECKDYEKL
ncbi:hypothetical protein [Nostoc sp.]